MEQIDHHPVTGWVGVNSGFKSKVAVALRTQGKRGGDRHGILARTADHVDSLAQNDALLILLWRLQWDSDDYQPSEGAMTVFARAGLNPTTAPLSGREAFNTLIAATVLDRITTEAMLEKNKDSGAAKVRDLSDQLAKEQGRTAEAERIAAERGQDASELRGQVKDLKKEIEELKEPALA